MHRAVEAETWMTIRGARQGNLKNITVRIPKGRFTVFTGVSGSGKSTLLVDVLYNECQRQYLEAIGYQGIAKPAVDAVNGASPAVLIGQASASNRNPRSTVGTVTNVYAELRMLFEKLSSRPCPLCGTMLSAAVCREETEKRGSDFFVYQYCTECGGRFPKLTRTDFSYNTREGACPECHGLGRVMAVDRAAAVNEKLSLEAGAVTFWVQKYREYQTGIFYAALAHYGVPVQPGTPVERYTPLQKTILYEGAACEAVRAAFPGVVPPRAVSQGRFEGVEPMLWRRLQEKQGGGADACFRQTRCRVCAGERLAELPRRAQVRDTRLPELSRCSLEELRVWLHRLRGSLTEREAKLTGPCMEDLEAKLRRLAAVGLGHLVLERGASTLSGGEAQRMRLAAALDAGITGILYILDEPTVGLHPQDTRRMVAVLQELRDKGNTVLVIEHDPDVMRAADYIIDIGPGAGACGGEVVACGAPQEIAEQRQSVTAQWLARRSVAARHARRGAGWALRVQDARLHNLRGVQAKFPAGCITAVTGVSGSGKSSLVFGVLAGGGRGEDGPCGEVQGLERFSGIVAVTQNSAVRMRRSNVATFTGLYDGVRALFAARPEAKAQGLGAGSFSFNTKGGRCETCEGLGVVPNNMLFFENTDVVCPDCGGDRFQKPVLSVRYKGMNIRELLDISAEQALGLFGDMPKLSRILALLCEAGLGYLALGQPLTALSGGEAQRLKLARELLAGGGADTLYLLDEPTVGLHPQDVAHFSTLLGRLADEGGTVVLVEHNMQLVAAADWVVDLGPGGGSVGGAVICAGTPGQVAACAASATGRALRAQGVAPETG